MSSGSFIQHVGSEAATVSTHGNQGKEVKKKVCRNKLGEE